MKRHLLLLVGIAFSGSVLAGPIHKAIEKGNVKQVEKLLESKPQFIKQQDNMGYYPLHTAAKVGDAEIAKILIEKGAKVDQVAQLIDPDLIERSQQRLQLYEEIAKGRDIPQEDIRKAKRRLPIAREQREKRKEPMTPLQVAVTQGNTEVARVLLNNGADPNIAKDDRWSLLHSAIIDDNMQLVKLLVDNGADVNAQARRGITPLNIAVSLDRLDIAQELIKNGANVNVADKSGEPLLFRARSAQAVKLLAENGADVNARAKIGLMIKRDGKREYLQEKGMTPLHEAASIGDVKVAKALLQHDAQPDVKTERGFTPLDLAKQNGHDKVVKMLKNA